jgi:hypothetical protein
MWDLLRFKLCPPFFGLNGIRYDTPSDNHREFYSLDLADFKKDKHRHLMLRTACFKEFDSEVETIGEWLRRPPLHVLAIQFSIGIHLLVPLYRGSRFWEPVSTDHEVEMILAEMAQRGGINVLEWEKYERERDARIKALGPGRNEGSDGVVN